MVFQRDCNIHWMVFSDTWWLGVSRTDRSALLSESNVQLCVLRWVKFGFTERVAWR